MNNSPCDESRHSAEYFEHWAPQSLGQDDADASSNQKQTGRLRMISSTAEEAVSVTLDLNSSKFLRRVATQKELLRAGDPQVAMTQTAYRQVMDHLTADTTREYGGLLYGQRIKAADGSYVGVLVLHAEPAAFSPGNSHRMSFTQETWLAYERMEDQWREAGIQWERLGWYHSHPDFSIFLSNHDLDVCSLFRHPTHIALVVDPCRIEGGFFVRGMEGFRPTHPQGFWEFSNETLESLVAWNNVVVKSQRQSADSHSLETDAETPHPQTESKVSQADTQDSTLPPRPYLAESFHWLRHQILRPQTVSRLPMVRIGCVALLCLMLGVQIGSHRAESSAIRALNQMDQKFQEQNQALKTLMDVQHRKTQQQVQRSLETWLAKAQTPDDEPNVQIVQPSPTPLLTTPSSPKAETSRAPEQRHVHWELLLKDSVQAIERYIATLPAIAEKPAPE